MVHLDTSVLVDAFTTSDRTARAVRAALEQSEVLTFSTLVLFEWLRGPRQTDELALVDALFPRPALAPFSDQEAARAADLYRAVKRPRGREVDLAIAACALTCGARLWTLNPEDFNDIPGLTLYRA